MPQESSVVVSARPDESTLRLSAETAKRIIAGRSDSAERVEWIIREDLAGVNAGTMEEWAADNERSYVRVLGVSLLDQLAAEALDLVTKTNQGLCGLSPEAFASLLLGSPDATYRTSLERLPQEALWLWRTYAHVQALGLGLHQPVAMGLARRATMLLLNWSTARRPVAMPSRAQVPTHETRAPRAEEDPVDPEAQDQGEVQVPEDSGPAKRAGRHVRGYVRTVQESRWGEGELMPAGESFELLVPDQRDRDDCAKYAAREKQAYCAVWWRGKTRLMPESDVAKISRAEYLTWVSEHAEKT